MEYELLDTGIFAEDRYFDVFVEYAKATPEDLLVQISISNRGPEESDLTCAAEPVVSKYMVMDTGSTNGHEDKEARAYTKPQIAQHWRARINLSSMPATTSIPHLK